MRPTFLWRSPVCSPLCWGRAVPRCCWVSVHAWTPERPSYPEKHESRVRSFPENRGRMKGYYWWAGVFSSMAVGWGYIWIIRIRTVEQKKQGGRDQPFSTGLWKNRRSWESSPQLGMKKSNTFPVDSHGFPVSEVKRNLPSKLPGISLEILNPRVYHISHHLQKPLLLHCLRQGNFQPFIERFHTAHGTIFFGVGLKTWSFKQFWSPQTRVKARRKGQLNEEDTFGHNILQENKSMVSETKKSSNNFYW